MRGWLSSTNLFYSSVTTWCRYCEPAISTEVECGARLYYLLHIVPIIVTVLPLLSQDDPLSTACNSFKRVWLLTWTHSFSSASSEMLLGDKATSDPSGKEGKCWVENEELCGWEGSIEISTLGQDDAVCMHISLSLLWIDFAGILQLVSMHNVQFQ